MPLPKVVHEFTVPEKLRNGGPIKIGMRLLTASEEEAASKMGGFNMFKTQYEAAKRSICELDDKPVEAAKGEVEKFWETAHPRLRSLVLQEYQRLSTPSEEEESSFFASENIRAG